MKLIESQKNIREMIIIIDGKESKESKEDIVQKAINKLV